MNNLRLNRFDAVVKKSIHQKQKRKNIREQKQIVKIQNDLTKQERERVSNATYAHVFVLVTI